MAIESKDDVIVSYAPGAGDKFAQKIVRTSATGQLVKTYYFDRSGRDLPAPEAK